VREVGLHVDARAAAQAQALQRPAPHDPRIVGYAVAAHRHFDGLVTSPEAPTVVRRLVDHEAQAVVPREVAWRGRHVLARELGLAAHTTRRLPFSSGSATMPESQS
jgi:hypothetical protein